MKTTYHSHLRGTNGCLGFYYGLEALLSDFPEGGLPGEFFINGETQSLWIWNAETHTWSDTNHVSPAPFMGLIANPETFSPSLSEGENGCFIYIVGQKGTYEFPMLSGSDAISVETESAGVIILLWDGTLWHSEFTPLSFDNTGSPVALFQGEWNASKSYKCENGFADVVSFGGDYYRLKSLVKEANMDLTPEESDEWELLPHYAAVANALELPEKAVISMRNGQTIECFKTEYEGYLFRNGSLLHRVTGTGFDSEGKVHVPMQAHNGYLILSPEGDDNGITMYDYNDVADLVFRLGFNYEEEVMFELRSKKGSKMYSIRIKADSLYFFGEDDKDEYLYFESTSAGLKAKIKHITDDLYPGDLYYDEDLYVRYWVE